MAELLEQVKQSILVAPVLVPGEFDEKYWEALKDEARQKDQELCDPIREKIGFLETELASLFEIEEDRKTQIRREVNSLEVTLRTNTNSGELGRVEQEYQGTKKQHESEQELSEAQRQIRAAGYTDWVPLDALSFRRTQVTLPGQLELPWRTIDTDGMIGKLPSLVLFSIDSPASFYEVVLGRKEGSPNEITSKIFSHPQYPSTLQAKMEDVSGHMAEIAQEIVPHMGSTKDKQSLESLRYRLIARFTGTMPENTREKTAQAVESGVFDSIWLLAEADEWAITFDAEQINVKKYAPKPQPISTLRRDPLVLGWSQYFPTQLWYIGAFDITDLENFVPVAVE